MTKCRELLTAEEQKWMDASMDNTKAWLVPSLRAAAERLSEARVLMAQGCDAETALEAVQGDVSFFELGNDTQDRVDAALSSPGEKE